MDTSAEEKVTDGTTEDLLRCSFCHKSKDDVTKLISSPSDYSPRVYICDECVWSCHSILVKDSMDQ